MSDRLKTGIESLSGMDLSDVRVHANSDKPARINALAFTQGNDIHLGPGQERHLPHEAWHVVQQRQGRVMPTLRTQGMAINDDAGLEIEADAMGQNASRAAWRGSRAERVASSNEPQGEWAVTPSAASTTQRKTAAAASVRLEDVQTLSDAELASEHQAVQAWLLAHESEKDSAYAQQLGYFNQLESEVVRRNPARIAAESRRRQLVGFVEKGTVVSGALFGPIGILGPAQAAFLTEFGFGLKDAISEQPAERKDRIMTRFANLNSLTGHWQDKIDYTLGYGKGIALGVWGEIKGIVDLIMLLPRLQLRANEWLASQLGKLSNADALLQKGRALYDELAGVAAKAVEEIAEFFGNPLQAMKKLAAMLEGLLSAGLSKAYELGQSAVEASFRFVEKPFKELGEELGKIAGAVLFQVVLLVATDAIGNLIAKGAGAAARLGRAVLEGAGEIFSGVKALAGEFLSLLRKLGQGVFKAFEGTMEALARLIQRVEAFFAELAELSAPERALAGGGKAPANVLMSEAKATSGVAKPGRTTMTTVEELRPPKTPGGQEAAATATGESALQPERVRERGKDILEIFEEGKGKAGQGALEEDMLESLSSVDKPAGLGGKKVPRRFEVGNFSHQYAEELVPAGKLPRGLDAEFKIPESSRRIDRVDWKQRKLFEIKPETAEQIEKGREQIDLYLKHMNHKYPPPNWQGEVVTYDRKAVERLLAKGWPK